MAPQAVYLEKIGVNWTVLYSSSELATLLWCMIFIVYCILRVGGIARRNVCAPPAGRYACGIRSPLLCGDSHSQSS